MAQSSSSNDIFSLAYGPNRQAYITVHDGKFHPDDVASVALASRFLGGLNNVNITRTRDPKLFRGLVMDVGEGEFDHHGKATSRGPDGIPDSAFSKLFNRVKYQITPNEQAHLYLKQHLVDPVSKLDNGVPLRRGEKSLFNWVPAFNNNYTERNDAKAQNERFMEAVRIADRIIDREIQNSIADAQTADLKRSILQDAQKQNVVYVPKGIDLSKELPDTNAKFSLTMLSDGTYRLQCVPKPRGSSFSKKVPFPREWAGLSNKELQQASGINDAIFCHSGRFLAGFKSRESAIAAAKHILRQRHSNKSSLS